MTASPGERFDRLITRRNVLAAGLAVAILGKTGSSYAAPLPRNTPDAWFWKAVESIEAGPPVGGPSAGVIDHSLFGVEAHRAGRVNPSETPPALAEFYLKVVIEPGTVDGLNWDVGFVWRINWQMDALWWMISNDGRWTLSSAIWELAPRDEQEIEPGELCAAIESPVSLQALAAGAQLALSVNHGAVIVVPIPDDREPGHIGVLANARADHLRPNGATPFRELAVWPVTAAGLPARLPAARRDGC